MEMLKTIWEARDKIEELGEYIGQMEKCARWGAELRASPVIFALELVAVRDAGKEARASLKMLENDIAAMLETLQGTTGGK